MQVESAISWSARSAFTTTAGVGVLEPLEQVGGPRAATSGARGFAPRRRAPDASGSSRWSADHQHDAIGPRSSRARRAPASAPRDRGRDDARSARSSAVESASRHSATAASPRSRGQTWSRKLTTAGVADGRRSCRAPRSRDCEHRTDRRRRAALPAARRAERCADLPEREHRLARAPRALGSREQRHQVRDGGRILKPPDREHGARAHRGVGWPRKRRSTPSG